MSRERSEIQAALEALLFVSGEPLSLKKIMTLLKIDRQELDEVLESMTARYAADASAGIWLVRHRDMIELTSKPEHDVLLQTFTKSFLQEHLSKPALEVLAIIAYRGPIARTAIEAIRGVNCSFTLRNLLIRGLIERTENPADAREYIYLPSLALIEKLGLRDQADLPNFATLSKDVRADVVLQESLTNPQPANESLA